MGAELVSLTGFFPLFHTPDDVPEHATTPQLLETAFDALLGAARALATA